MAPDPSRFDFPGELEEPHHALLELTNASSTFTGETNNAATGGKRKRGQRFAGSQQQQLNIVSPTPTADLGAAPGPNQARSIPLEATMAPFFFDEKAAVHYLMEEGVIVLPDHCPVCNASSKWLKPKGLYPKNGCFVLRCNNPTCAGGQKNKPRPGRFQQSFFHKTFLADSRIAKNKVLQFLYLWCCKASHQQIMVQLGWSSSTTTNYMRKARELVAQSIRVGNYEQIGGPGVVLEVDEAKMGECKYHRGHPVNATWVFGGVERTKERRMFAITVPDRKAATLLPLIEHYIAPGSIIHSDCWKAYNGIEGMQDANGQSYDYTHHTVNHSLTYVAEDGTHTNTIEGTWFGVKQNIRPRSRTGKLLDMHLFEFMWRRENQGRIWEAMLDALRHTEY